MIALSDDLLAKIFAYVDPWTFVRSVAVAQRGRQFDWYTKSAFNGRVTFGPDDGHK